jgi:hypothetical protein
MDSWSQLSLFESADVLNKLQHPVHGTGLKAEKAAEVASYFAHGREYFYAADNAGFLVRPLLQYYGVLSLSRGLILLLDKSLRAASLPKQHGLKPLDWKSLFSADKNKVLDLSDKNKFLNLSVEVTRSTFLRLLETTCNGEVSVIFREPYPARLNVIRCHLTNGI